MRGRRVAAELGLRGHGALAAVVPHRGDVLVLIERGSPVSAQFLPFALCFQTSQRKQNTKR